ncbi:MAG: class I SAM-dependent methyltransferase [Candidatus Nanopelagicales bacterium]|nr:class I SAM-dependent methyltransferase [Candidatus Nanopelagicales bacterium]MDZ4248964.1 class I SAM-dependent methyltransferase [Candidatus Nanopelagicales bacterium]
MKKSVDPLTITGSTQADNQAWWERHPMTYEDWGSSNEFDENDPASYKRVDEIFFERSRHFAHPGPGQSPFGALIDQEDVEGKRVLEIGCGMGSHAELLARGGAQLTAVDLTETAVRRTSKRLRLSGLDGTVLQVDASTLPFPDCSFDVVWSWGVIHHSVDPAAIVTEIYRVLEPGGRAKLMVYHRRSLRYFVRGGLQEGILRRRLRRESLHDINMSFTDGAIAHHYTRREARDMFGKFRDVRTAVYDGEEAAYLPGVGKRLRRIAPRQMMRVDEWLQKRCGWFLFIDATK